MTHAYKLVALAALASATLALAPCTRAQTTNLNNTTSTPVPGSNRDYIKMLSETVDPASGSVSIRVQVPVPPGRGLTLPFSFAYDSGSSTYPIPGTPGNAKWYLSSNTGFTPYLFSGGWGYSVPQLTVSFFHQNHTANGQGYECAFTTGYTLQDASGGRHLLPIGFVFGGSGNTEPCPQSVPSGSEPFYSAASGKAADADGTIYTFPSSFVDDSAGTEVGSYQLRRRPKRHHEITITTGSASGSFTEADTAGFGPRSCHQASVLPATQ